MLVAQNLISTHAPQRQVRVALPGKAGTDAWFRGRRKEPNLRTEFPSPSPHQGRSTGSFLEPCQMASARGSGASRIESLLLLVLRCRRLPRIVSKSRVVPEP